MAAIGAFLSGAVQGYDRSLEQRRNEERDQRERTRFEMEKKELERKDAERTRQEDIRSRMESLNKEYQSQSGAFSQFASPEQQAVGQEVERKAALSFGRAEDAKFARQAGITPPGAGQVPQESASVTPQEDGFLKAPMKYQNPRAAEDLYYKQLSGLLKEDYANKGDLGRATMVDAEIAGLREKQYEPARRAAAAAAIMGAGPEALQPLLDKVYGAWNDGRDMKVLSSSVDPKTNMPVYQMQFVDNKTGQKVERALSGTQLYGMLRDADAFNVVKFNVERGDTDRAFGLKERQLDIEGKVADARIKEAGATASFRAAQQAALTDSIKGADIKAKGETLAKMFPLAGSDIDPTKMLGKKPEEIAQRRTQIDNDTLGLSLAERFVGLNPKVDPRVIGAAAKASFGGTLKQERDESNGRSFLNYGGTKIYID